MITARNDVFLKDRDEAFIDFVTTGSWVKLNEYLNKYNVETPKNKLVMAAGIYKAVQLCTGIPDDIKALAAEKCRMIGFKPTID